MSRLDEEVSKRVETVGTGETGETVEARGKAVETFRWDTREFPKDAGDKQQAGGCQGSGIAPCCSFPLLLQPFCLLVPCGLTCTRHDAAAFLPVVAPI